MNMNMNINMNTYLGQKGFTIPKNELTQDQIEEIKKDLTIRPFVPGGPKVATVTFPAYRESPLKLYVPHYYGVEHFGEPKTVKVSEGGNIDQSVIFTGSLRDIQINVSDTYINHVTKKGYGGGLIELACGMGKTVIGLNIISRLMKKTLIIVHKEFLMNQWIERIEQFLPKARVGKIQGAVIDIEGKDIVIGMLQSLSMKDYDSSVFDTFGLTIIDEVHHISSEVFSNSLFKIVTKYMLGLSATMNRKDGTTKVFKMFLGPIVFTGKREEQFNVEVRGIEYQTNDDQFNEVATDFRGNVAHSTMITKLCSYNRRSEFILKVLQDLFIENPEQQVMILAHNKSLLKYLYDAVEHRKIAEGSVGYYVGGMKESSLKETEGKRIVIATYAMAAEALDIKTLSTLIMATPKTDIEQSVGRILREKHKQPIVVDIIDTHEPFQNQWNKRKQFYKKENYKVIHTTSVKYLSCDKPYLNKEIWMTVSSQVIKKQCSQKKIDIVIPSPTSNPSICLIPSIKKTTNI